MFLKKFYFLPIIFLSVSIYGTAEDWRETFVDAVKKDDHSTVMFLAKEQGGKKTFQEAEKYAIDKKEFLAAEKIAFYGKLHDMDRNKKWTSEDYSLAGLGIIITGVFGLVFLNSCQPLFLAAANRIDPTHTYRP